MSKGKKGEGEGEGREVRRREDAMRRRNRWSEIAHSLAYILIMNDTLRNEPLTPPCSQREWTHETALEWADKHCSNQEDGPTRKQLAPPGVARVLLLDSCPGARTELARDVAAFRIPQGWKAAMGR